MTTTIALKADPNLVQTTIFSTYQSSTKIPALRKTSPASTYESILDSNEVPTADIGTQASPLTNMITTSNVSRLNATTSLTEDNSAGIG